MTKLFLLFFLVLQSSSESHAQAISETLKTIEVDCSKRLSKFFRPDHCLLFRRKNLNDHLKLTPMRLIAITHLHVPRLHIYEEEDDVLGDNIYMWFVITIDGVTRTHITKVYKGFHAGDVITFDHVDRVINQSLYRNSLVIDFGIVESDGDDINKLKEITELGLRIFQNHISDEERRYLHELTVEFFQVISNLPNDDRLVTGSYHIKVEDVLLTYQAGGVREHLQTFSGHNYWSDWSYGLVWRHIMVDIPQSAL